MGIQEVSWTVYIPSLPKTAPTFKTLPLPKLEAFMSLMHGRKYEDMDALLHYLKQPPSRWVGACVRARVCVGSHPATNKDGWPSKPHF